MFAHSAVEKPARKHKRQKDAASAPGASLNNADRPRISKKANAVDAKSDAAHGSAPVVATNVSGQSETVVKEKKHKKRRHVEQEEATEERQDVDEPKKKKRKHAKDSAVENGTGDLASAVEASVSKDEKGKEKKVDAADAADAGADEGKGKHAKEARRNKAGETTAGDSAESPVQAELQKHRKSKKDKKRKKGIANAEENEEDVLESGGKHDKKKRKRRSSLPDPSEDESLSEHARKALQYAFTQFDDTTSWKFNKARQNWLIRNVANDEVIPETYMPLVLRYLQGVQGGVRETLVKTCRDAIQSTPSEVSTQSSREPEKSTDGDDPSSPAKPTVRFAVEEPSNKSNSSDETKRRRAASLLAVLVPEIQ
ncbi:hypothetical protein C8Q74DRAFT_1368405 [Fomes fomentarius]|nr:hypothetical protein C8Q74DRAFT_1368405 [Fomes fomentarius]